MKRIILFVAVFMLIASVLSGCSGPQEPAATPAPAPEALQTAEPEAAPAEPEAAEPEATEAAPAEPEAAEPEATEAAPAEPEATAPAEVEAAEAAPAEPVVAEPEAEAAAPAVESKAVEPETEPLDAEAAEPADELEAEPLDAEAAESAAELEAEPLDAEAAEPAAELEAEPLDAEAAEPAAETTAAEPEAAPAEVAEPAVNLDADITVVQSLDMVSWDPVNTSDLSNGYVINNIYSKLFTFDENINGIPELCESYELIGDSEWHFKIHPDVKCHDGSILTADDVVYSLNRTKNGTAIGALFGPVKEITKVDDLTISITTDGPYPALPTALTHQATCIVPQAYSEKAEADNDWTQPIGSGRYVFESRVIGDSVKLVRFDDYFDQSDAAMNKSLTIKVIPEGTSRTIAIETGAADVNVDFDTVDYDRVKANPDLKLWEHYSQTVWHLGMDNTHEWFKNKLVRQAVNYAIDRAACLEVGHNGQGTVMYNCATFAPTCLGAVENPLDMYSYDPEKAKALMAEAGCTGFETEIIVFRDETERIAVLCQAYLAEIGITANVSRIENAVFASTIQEHKAPMFITSWGAYWDPDLFLARRFSQAGIGGVNRVFYLNEELDKLILEGRSTFDEAKRAETYKKVQEFLAEEAPEVDLYVSVMFALANKDLKGVEINVERPYNYYKLHY